MSSSSHHPNVYPPNAQREASNRVRTAEPGQPSNTSTTQPRTSGGPNTTSSDEPIIEDIDDIEPYIPVRIITPEDVTPVHKAAMSRFFAAIMREPTVVSIVSHYGASVMLAEVEAAARAEFPDNQWFITRQPDANNRAAGQGEEATGAPRSVLSDSKEVFLFGSSTEFAGSQ